jgi:hypothetical protein
MALTAGAVTAFAGWLLAALVGHAYKVVPFITWSALRARGITVNKAGGPLGFADLYDHRAAAGVYALLTAGVAAVCTGFALSWPTAVAAGGIMPSAAGATAAVNLSAIPARMLRRRRYGPGSPSRPAP